MYLRPAGAEFSVLSSFFQGQNAPGYEPLPLRGDNPPSVQGVSGAQPCAPLDVENRRARYNERVSPRTRTGTSPMSPSPRTLRRDPRVFISAVTSELGTVRELAKKALLDSGCHPIEQDNFPPDYRDMVDLHRHLIEPCDAVIHIAGHCH